ncbi:MAG: hypothetical protein WCL00_00735 [Bacteroidota bacterium]
MACNGNSAGLLSPMNCNLPEALSIQDVRIRGYSPLVGGSPLNISNRIGYC